MDKAENWYSESLQYPSGSKKENGGENRLQNCKLLDFCLLRFILTVLFFCIIGSFLFF